MDIISLLILRALSGGGSGDIPVASQINYDNSTSGLDAENVQNAIDELSSKKINTSEKGTANGVAELNENGIILTSQLPSYVDDVLEYNTYSDFPQEGESGKIYVDLSTNKTYRWGGSSYVEISPSLALGETSSTAYRGDRGKAAYDHSQLTTGNPHNVTKTDVGLGNVDNTSDLNKPISTATQTALDTKTNVADVEEMIEDTFNDNTVTGNSISFETVVGTEQAKSCEVTFLPIQSGSGDPSPENPRPISGWDSLGLAQSGSVNIADFKDGYGIDNNGNVVAQSGRCATMTAVPIFSNLDYYIYTENSASCVYSVFNGTTLVRIVSGVLSNSLLDTSNGDKLYCCIYKGSSDVSVANNKPMVNVGEVASAYEPFVSLKTNTATFPDTIYEGSYDFVSGNGQSTMVSVAISNLNFSTIPTSYGQCFGVAIPTKANNMNFICSAYPNKQVGRTSLNDKEMGSYNTSTTMTTICIRDDTYTTVEDFKTAMGTQTICYELATPTEIILTNETIELLKGNNTLWTNGDNITLKYSADIPSYVEQAIEDAKELPSVTSVDNGKFLGVSSGAWTKINSPLPSATSSNANNILNINSIGNYELIKPYIVNFNVGISNGVCSFYDGKRPSDVYAIMYGNGVHGICSLTIYSGVENVKFLSCKFNSSNNLVAYTFYEDSGDLYYEEFVWSLQSSADSSSHTKRKIKELPTVTSTDEGKVLTVDSSGNWVTQDLPDGTNISY